MKTKAIHALLVAMAFLLAAHPGRDAFGQERTSDKRATLADLPPLPAGLTREQWNQQEVEKIRLAVSQITSALQSGVLPRGLFDQLEDARDAVEWQEKQRTGAVQDLREQLAALRGKLERYRALDLRPTGGPVPTRWSGPSTAMKIDKDSFRAVALRVPAEAKQRIDRGVCDERTLRRLSAAYGALVGSQEGREGQLLLHRCGQLQAASRAAHGHPNSAISAQDFFAAANRALTAARTAKSGAEKKAADKALGAALGIGEVIEKTAAVNAKRRELRVARSRLVHGPRRTDAAITADGGVDLNAMRQIGIEGLRKSAEVMKRQRPADPLRAAQMQAAAYALSHIPSKGEQAELAKASELSTRAACHAKKEEFASAVSTQESYIAARKKLTPNDLPQLTNARSVLVTYLQQASRDQEAEAELDQLIEMVEKARKENVNFPGSEMFLAGLYDSKSDLLFARGDLEGSRLAHERAKAVPANALVQGYEKMVDGMFGGMSHMDVAKRERDFRLMSVDEVARVLDREKKLDSFSLSRLAAAFAAAGNHDKAVAVLEQAVAAASADMSHARQLGAAAGMHQAGPAFIMMHLGPAIALSAERPEDVRARLLAFQIVSSTKDQAFQALGQVVPDSSMTSARLAMARQLRSQEAANYLAKLHEPVKPTDPCAPISLKDFGMSKDSIETKEQAILQPDSFKKAVLGGRMLLLGAIDRTTVTPGADLLFKRITDRLPGDTALLEFVVFHPARFEHPFVPSKEPLPAKRYAVLIARPKGQAPALVDLGPADRIEAQIQKLRHALSAPPSRPDAPPSPALIAEAKATFDLLLPGAVRDALRGAKRLIVIPDGAVRSLPLGTLHDGKGWLLESLRIRYLLSSEELLRPPARPPSAKAKGVVFANPLPPAAQYQAPVLQPARWPALRHSHAEAVEVSAIYPGTRIIEQTAFNEAALLSTQSPLFLHVAGHAIALGESGGTTSQGRGSSFRPKASPASAPKPTAPPLPNDRVAWLRATIVASPPSGKSPSEDSFTTAFEITRMDLRGTEMVVLSACDSGVGDDIQGLHSLGRAFGIAGARSVIATFWSLEDASAAGVMRDFYQGLARGQSRSEALHHARLQAKANHPHPFFWGPWSMLGQDGKMPLPSSGTPATQPTRSP